MNIYNIEPTKFPFQNKDNYSIYGDTSNGPCFGGGHDIGVDKVDFLNNDSYVNFPYSYKDVLQKGNSIFTGDINKNNKKFKLKEIEVFKILK